MKIPKRQMGMQAQHILLKLFCASLFFPLLETKSLAQSQTPEELYVHLENTIVVNGNSPHYDFSWVTPEIRAELIQYAYTTSSNTLPNPQFITSKDALLMLGDPATVQEAVNAYRKADGAESLGGPPESILPYLIDDLTHASSEDHIPLGYSLMDKSLMCSFAVISSWPAFPAATRAWAADSYHKIGLYYLLGPNTNANRMMRKWWEHNKEAILSRQYDKATWLPPASEEVPDGPLATAPSASSQLNPTQPTPAPQVQPAIDTSIGWGFVWPIAIAVVTLASGLFLVRLLTKK
jgi:hypothetical protein